MRQKLVASESYEQKNKRNICDVHTRSGFRSGTSSGGQKIQIQNVSKGGVLQLDGGLCSEHGADTE